MKTPLNFVWIEGRFCATLLSSAISLSMASMLR